jgi:hypothetical protein
MQRCFCSQTRRPKNGQGNIDGRLAVRGMCRLSLLTFCLLWIAACAGSGSADDVSSSTSDVDVALAEWSVTPSPDSVSSGQVTFNVSNEGTKIHDLLIVKDVAPADLPTEQRG